MNASKNISLAILIFVLLASFVSTAELSKQPPMQVEGEEGWSETVIPGILASLKAQLVKMSSAYPELVGARDIHIHEALEGTPLCGLDYFHNCKYWGTRGYKDTGSNAVHISFKITTQPKQDGVLDPVNPERVEDTNDNGVLDNNEKDGNASAPHDDGDNDFDGDYPVTSAGAYPWEYDHDLSPKDIDSDGKVECPSKAQVPVNPDDEYTKAEVVRHTITHEMGHATGISGHCDDDTCVMYNTTNNWNRDGHFCNDCRGEIRIHNN